MQLLRETLDEFRKLYAAEKSLAEAVTPDLAEADQSSAIGEIAALDDDRPQFVEPRSRKGETLMNDLTKPFQQFCDLQNRRQFINRAGIGLGAAAVSSLSLPATAALPRGCHHTAQSQAGDFPVYGRRPQPVGLVRLQARSGQTPRAAVTQGNQHGATRDGDDAGQGPVRVRLDLQVRAEGSNPGFICPNSCRIFRSMRTICA